MALSRCIETRLMEAVLREVKACFAQADLGLATIYADRIYARPWSEGEPITPHTVYVNPSPLMWEPGASGVSVNIYAVEVAFVFPWNAANFANGQNTFLDHVEELRAWLVTGGTMPNNHLDIEDPDNAGASLGWLRSFRWTDPQPAPGNAGMAVPVILEYETRETKAGVRA